MILYMDIFFRSVRKVGYLVFRQGLWSWVLLKSGTMETYPLVWILYGGLGGVSLTVGWFTAVNSDYGRRCATLNALNHKLY